MFLGWLLPFLWFWTNCLHQRASNDVPFDATQDQHLIRSSPNPTSWRINPRGILESPRRRTYLGPALPNNSICFLSLGGLTSCQVISADQDTDEPSGAMAIVAPNRAKGRFLSFREIMIKRCPDLGEFACGWTRGPKGMLQHVSIGSLCSIHPYESVVFPYRGSETTHKWDHDPTEVLKDYCNSAAITRRFHRPSASATKATRPDQLLRSAATEAAQHLKGVNRLMFLLMAPKSYPLGGAGRWILWGRLAQASAAAAEIKRKFQQFLELPFNIQLISCSFVLWLWAKPLQKND